MRQNGNDGEPDMERRTERWHVGKEIPLALIFAIAVQTIGAIWWAAGISNKLDTLALQVSEIRSERYTREDARRDNALVQQRFSDMERRMAVCENRHIDSRERR